MLNQTLCSSGVELLTMMMIILVDIVLRMMMMMMMMIILVDIVLRMLRMLRIILLRMLTSFGSRTPLGESPLSGCRWEVLKDHLCNDHHHNDH